METYLLLHNVDPAVRGHSRTGYIYENDCKSRKKKRSRKINEREGAKTVTYLLLHFVYSVGTRTQRIYLRQRPSLSGTEKQID